MNIIDVGSGPPLVLVPGIQGRWEWMKPAVEALRTRCRVLTFSLADEPSFGGAFDEARGFDAYVEQIREALDTRGIQAATICGVSFGGLIAARFAARYPDRATALVLVSALPPGWSPDRRARFYLRAPRLLFPLFLVGSLRMCPEIAAAAAGVGPGLRLGIRHGLNVLTHMLSPTRMARRVHMILPLDLSEGLDRVNVPTLLVTGEAALDRVVPVALTASYRRIWPDATHVTLRRTGHLGLITRPAEFAAIVADFVERAVGGPAASGGRSAPADDAALRSVRVERKIG